MSDQLALPLLAWRTGPLCPDCREAIREGYTHLIRAADDPERAPRKRVTDPTRDVTPHRTIGKTSAAAWSTAIVDLLADGQARTFNRICLELADVTADVAATTPLNAAIWDTVEAGQVEHSFVIPIRFRHARPETSRVPVCVEST